MTQNFEQYFLEDVQHSVSEGKAGSGNRLLALNDSPISPANTEELK